MRRNVDIVDYIVALDEAMNFEPVINKRKTMESLEQPEPPVGDALPTDTAWRFVVTTLLVICGLVCMVLFSVWVGFLLWVGAYGIAARIPFPGQGKPGNDNGSNK
jgi:hypothetical protein